jgi:hypothetical protein
VVGCVMLNQRAAGQWINKRALNANALRPHNQAARAV